MKIKAYSYLKSQEMYAKTASAQPEASVQPRAGSSSTEARRRSTDSCPGPLPTSGGGEGRGKERQEWGCPVLSFALRSLTPHFQTLGKEIRTARLPLPTPPATRAVPPARAAGAPRRARSSPAHHRSRPLHLQHVARGLAHTHQNRSAAPDPEALETWL